MDSVNDSWAIFSSIWMSSSLHLHSVGDPFPSRRV